MIQEILKKGIEVLGQIGIVEKKLLKGLFKNKIASSKLKSPMISSKRPEELN